MSKLTTKPDHGVPIVTIEGKPYSISQLFQSFFDDLQIKLNAKLLGEFIVLESYTVATLPTVPVASSPGIIYVSDETGGPVLAFSDGTNWRRCTDRAIVS